MNQSAIMQTLALNQLLIIDIETVSQYPGFECMDDSWKQLWQEKVMKILPAGVSAAEFYLQRAGVMAEFAKIICISVGWLKQDESGVDMFLRSFFGNDEHELLSKFIVAMNERNEGLNDWCFVGHNIKEFDIPFICRRLLVHGLPIPNYLDFQNKKPWETNLIDTFQYWRFGDYKNYTSLKLLSAVLQVPSSKEDIDGSMVGALYWASDPVEQQNNVHRIVAYCQQDVVATGNILLRFKGMSLLNQQQIFNIE